MDKLLEKTHTAVKAVKENLPFLDSENEPKSDRYEFNPKSNRFHDRENGYRFVSRAVALGGTALSQTVEKPSRISEGNSAWGDDPDNQVGVAEVAVRQGMNLEYIKCVIQSGEIDAMQEAYHKLSTLINNSLEDGEFTDETLYLDALRGRLLDGMVRASKADSNIEDALQKVVQHDEPNSKNISGSAVVYGPSIDELTASGSYESESDSSESTGDGSDGDEGEGGEGIGVGADKVRGVPELSADSLLMLKDIDPGLYGEYEEARIELVKVHADERGSDFAGLLDDVSGRYGWIGWARNKLGKKVDKLSNRRLKATEKYDAIFLRARDAVIAEHHKLTPMTDEQKFRNEMVIDANSAERLEYDISETRIAIDTDKSPVSRRLAALTAIAFASLAGGASAAVDGEGRGGSDHPSMFWGSIFGGAIIGGIGFAQSSKEQAGHMNSEEAVKSRAQTARFRVLRAYEENGEGMRGRVEAANVVGGITSEIQDERYKKKRNAAIGGAALGGIAAGATAGGVHYGVDQIATYHDVGADLYLFDGQVDVWDGDPVDFWEGDLLPEGNDADKLDDSRNVVENVGSFPDDVANPDIVTRRPPLDINLSVYDGPGWDLDPFDGDGIDPNPFDEGALDGEGITVEITAPPEPEVPVVEQPVQEPVAPPPASDQVTPVEVDDPTERAMYINEDHGISHEVMDEAESHGIYVPPERAGDIAEQLESLGAENILEGQTLYPHDGSLRIEEAGPDRWTPQAQELIDSSLDTNGDGTLNELDNEETLLDDAEIEVREVTFYQNEGFSYGIQRYAAENGIVLDGAQSNALYLDLANEVGGEHIIDGPSFQMENGYWGISEPGTYSWTPRAQEYIDERLGITVGV